MRRLPRQILPQLSAEQWAELASNTSAHLNLVFEAMLLAVALGIPLGVMASRSRWLERGVLAFANISQTIPSLALLGFLVIFLRGRIGKTPALMALVVYALLPIIKNTILGLRGIDRGVAEAALGLGMTRWQRLRLVELPLAVPIILGGVRVATVASVGMATIAAAIGAGGLGSYIFRGISTSNTDMILLGAIPAALLALLFDSALGEIERALTPALARRSLSRIVLAWATVLALLAGAAWGGLAEFRSRPDGRSIVIGSKDSSEMILLGHMLADLVEAETDLKVDRRMNLNGTLVCYNALKDGGLDAYIEYTGTALTAILHEKPMSDPKAVFARVRDVCGRRDDVTCLDPLGFENTFAILMRREQAERLNIRSISDLRDHMSSLRPGFGPEFMVRPDGYPGLIRTYDLRFAHPPREMDRNLLYQAVALKTIDVAAGDSTDGRIATQDLVVLKDDRRYFPPYEAVPLVRGAALREHPELKSILNRLAGRLDARSMQRLNYEVDGLHKDVREVAKAYLISAGLLKLKANPPPRGDQP